MPYCPAVTSCQVCNAGALVFSHKFETAADYCTFNHEVDVLLPHSFPVVATSYGRTPIHKCDMQGAGGGGDEPAYTRRKIREFLCIHTAYELIPESGKVIMLDADLPMRQGFHALHEQVGFGILISSCFLKFSSHARNEQVSCGVLHQEASALWKYLQAAGSHALH